MGTTPLFYDGRRETGEVGEEGDGGGGGRGRVWEGEIYGRGEVLLTSKSAQEIPSLVRATPDKYVFNVPP